MAVTNDKLLLFKSHSASKGLSEEVLREICEAAELVTLDSGDYLHRADQPATSVFLIVHGRLKETVVDMHGALLMHRFLKRGSQFGVLAAARAEAVPVDVIAVEPSATLKFDFDTFLRFTRDHEAFGLNLLQLISGMVRDVLLADRKPKHASLVTVFQQSDATRPLMRRLIDRLVKIGESICVLSDRAEWTEIPGVQHCSMMKDGRVISREDFRRQVSEWSEHDRILIELDSAFDPVSASQFVQLTDQVVWCCDPTNAAVSTSRLHAIEAAAPGCRDKINLVWVLQEEMQVGPSAEPLSELVDREFKVVDGTDGPAQGSALFDGLERLVHQLRGIRIGLALGGGGARGMAHLGVLKALQNSGIVVDMIAGTSAGAMTGVLHAAGLDPEFLVQRFSDDLKPGWPFRAMPGGKNWYLLYKYRLGHFDRMLRKYLSQWRLEQLPIPALSVTVDLISGQPVFRDKGDAVDAILESINLPVFSKPICRDGRALVDGGLIDNIPADLLVRRGCNFVIAVSVTSDLESEFAFNTPTTPTAEMKSASTLQTALRSYLVQHVNMNSIGVQPADVVISPDVAGVELSDFAQTRQLAEAGELAALASMPNLKSLLARLDKNLFPTA